DDERALFLKPDFLKRVSAFDPVAVLPKLTGRHIRFSQVEKNSSVPAEAQKKIAAALPPTAMRQQLHNPAQVEEMAESRSNSVRWIKNQLKGSEPQSAGSGSKSQGNASLRTAPVTNLGSDGPSN